jgi:sterol desaturase/sphingolipid hydroxylase (fatty acid hydroxylase superfamily)
MTEAELIEASATYNGLMQVWISAYFTAFTAFMITAYLAGNKLNRNQVVFVSAGFFLFSSLCTFAAYGTGSLLVDFANEVEAINPERNFVANYPTIYAGVIVLAIGILGSLKFMWDIRHPKT